MNTICNRRSIRKYSEKDVTNDTLYQLLELAERTQTMGNLQLYSVVITRDKEMKQKLNFKYIIVDEFQDIGKLERDFFKALNESIHAGKTDLYTQSATGYNLGSNYMSAANIANQATENVLLKSMHLLAMISITMLKMI